jgi:hypothetical protein
MEERRRFDRIDDRVSMTYKVIEQDNLNEVLASLKKSSGRKQRLQGAKDKGDHHDLIPTQKISLSAGGASFHAPQSVRIHDHLEITLTLFPDECLVKVVGRVIGCREALPSAPEFNSLVAVDFIAMHEQDRQYIISHVSKKRSAETSESSS